MSLHEAFRLSDVPIRTLSMRMSAMTSKHHRWQERWDLNQDDGLAVHDTGLRVRLHDSLGVADNASEVEQSLVPQHGAHNAPAMVRRLIREGAQMLLDPGARGWRG